MEVSRDGQICAIFGKGDLFGANPKSEKAERSSANVRALRKMLKLTDIIGSYTLVHVMQHEKVIAICNIST